MVGWVIDSVRVQDSDGRLSLLPLRLPGRGRRSGARAVHVAAAVNGIAATVHDISQADDQLYIQCRFVAYDPVGLILEYVSGGSVVVLSVGKKDNTEIGIRARNGNLRGLGTGIGCPGCNRCSETR